MVLQNNGPIYLLPCIGMAYEGPYLCWHVHLRLPRLQFKRIGKRRLAPRMCVLCGGGTARLFDGLCSRHTHIEMSSVVLAHIVMAYIGVASMALAC